VIESAVSALERSFDTGDRSDFEALFAPGCVTWHNSDKVEEVSAGAEGVALLHQLVEGVRVDIVQRETLSSGELIRLVLRGTVRQSGRAFEVHNCIVLTWDDAGITRIDEYVDPTLIEQLTGAAG
jgi:ketosteroid isomerase-like protein